MAKSRETKDKDFLRKPVYEGGLKAMREFIRKNLKYPPAALKEKTEGTVFVKYRVNHKGKVIEAKAISGIGNGCDEEAVRLVKLFEFTVPKNRKLRVIFNKNIKIHFRLPKAAPKKPVSSAGAIQYNYVTTSSKKNTSTPPKKKSAYNIVIKYS